jgi:hypothetical protein
MNCPECTKEMENGFLYVRGFGGSLLWGKMKDIGLLSRRELQQIDLSKLSLTGVSTQAVLGASRCLSCGTLAFKAFSSESVKGPR